MHKFYLTSNLGGGGTNVSRYAVYKNMLECSNIGILLNYYYLHVIEKGSFDHDILSTYKHYDDIRTFLVAIKKHFVGKDRISKNYANDFSENNIDNYLLDSGVGNIIRDLLSRSEFDADHLKRLIHEYHEYAEKLKFDIVIAFDYALKYTYKKGERQDKILTDAWEAIAANSKANLELLKWTLEELCSHDYEHQTYAAIHGFDFKSYEQYLSSIIALAESFGHTFPGYALGGVGDIRNVKDELWDIPDGLSQNQKSAYIVSKLCKQSKHLIGNAPLHVLASGNLFSIPFITYAGASSSDCHSAWRRASDGDTKVLIPLFDNKLQYANEENCLTYIKLKDMDDNQYAFDFYGDLSIAELKKMYAAGGEDYYYCQLVLFNHAIKQYDLMIDFINENQENYLKLLCKCPDKELSTEYSILANLLG